MNAFVQFFQMFSMLFTAVQKLISSVDDCATMLNTATETALTEQQLEAGDRLAKLRAELADTTPTIKEAIATGELKPE